MTDQTEYEAVQAAETWLAAPDEPYHYGPPDTCPACDSEDIWADDASGEWTCRDCGHGSED